MVGVNETMVETFMMGKVAGVFVGISWEGLTGKNIPRDSFSEKVRRILFFQTRWAHDANEKHCPMITNLPQAIIFNVVSFLDHFDLMTVRKLSPDFKLAADTFGSMQETRMVVQRFLSPTPAFHTSVERLVARYIRQNHETLTPNGGIRVLAAEYYEHFYGSTDLMFMEMIVYYMDSKGKDYRAKRGFWFSNSVEAIERDNPFVMHPYLGDLYLGDAWNHEGHMLGGEPSEREYQ